MQEGTGFDPNPDYDASDELEYAIDWFPWILRGVYPPSPIHLNRTCAPISAL